ncbi:MAG TPA: restriction endonuclease subunit S [bacterium]|nr:restriction endonuclease subunit S [bacterium]
MSRKFQCKAIPSTWLEHNGRRLDCGPYMSGAIEARELLKRHETEALQSLTAGYNGGIYNGPQFVRNYVEDPAFGVPFLTTSTMQQSDTSGLPMISRKDAHSSKLRYLKVNEGMTLITCSGSIGKMAYARKDMEKAWSNQDIMKVVADRAKILPGYLYAYLSSRFGVPMVVSGTYGAIIQHIEPHHISDLPVPRLSEIENQAHDLIQGAANLRVEAAEIIAQISAEVERRFDLWDESLSDKARIARNGFLTTSTALAESGRFEATYHDAIAAAIADRVQSQPNTRIDIVCKVKKPGMFKRIMVDGPEHGYGFVPGSELFTLAPKPVYWVSPRTPNIEDCVMSPYWILIQAFGQLGGLIGRCIMTTPMLEGCAATDLQIQLRFDNKLDAGYVFAILYSRPGYKLITRTPIGGSIPHIHPKDIESLCIPWPEADVRHAIGERIIEAWDKREEAVRLEDEARSLVERTIEEGGH